MRKILILSVCLVALALLLPAVSVSARSSRLTPGTAPGVGNTGELYLVHVGRSTSTTTTETNEERLQRRERMNNDVAVYTMGILAGTGNVAGAGAFATVGGAYAWWSTRNCRTTTTTKISWSREIRFRRFGGGGGGRPSRFTP